MFLRAISSFKYNYGEDFANQWEIGAGTVFPYGKNSDDDYKHQKKFFIDDLGLSEEDFKYMRYNIRLQDELAGGTVNHVSQNVFDSKDGWFSTGNNTNYKKRWKTLMGVN